MNLINSITSTAAAAAAFGALSLWLSNKTLTVCRYEIKSDTLPLAANGLKILQLSDLHKKKFGTNYHQLLQKIKSEGRFDLICLTGDMMSRSEKDISYKRSLFCELTKIAPTFFVMGNHEADNPGVYKKLKEILLDCGVCVLQNSRVSFFKNGAEITLSGLAFSKNYYRNEHGGFSSLPYPTLKGITNALGQKPQNFEIMLSHNPLYAKTYGEYGADLVLCGHIHGGAVRLPFVGGLLSPERRFFPKYDSGLFTLSKQSGSQMVVSKGLGKLRLFNPPEITVITLNSNQQV